MFVAAIVVSLSCYRVHRSHFLEAQRAYREDRLADAATHLEKCLAFEGRVFIGYWPWNKLHPDTEDVLLLGSRIERMRWNYGKAKRYLDECYNKVGRTDAVRLERNLLLAQQGELAEVEGDLWAQVSEGSPQAPRVLETLADTYMKAMILHRAKECLDRWLHLEPENVRALNWRGWVLEITQNKEGAYKDYQKVLEIAPTHFQARFQVAQMLLQESNTQEAANHIRVLRASQPENGKVRVLLAKSLLLQGNLDEAQEHLDASLAKDPRDAEAMYQRGQLANQKGKLVEAEAWFRRTLKINGAHTPAHYALCLCLQQQPGKELEAAMELKNYREMSQQARRLPQLLGDLEKSPGDFDLLARVGRIYFRANNEYFARLYLSRANRVNPENKEIRDLLVALQTKSMPEK